VSGAFTVTGVTAGVELTVYDRISDPPELKGTVHETFALRLSAPEPATTLRGAVGTVGPGGGGGTGGTAITGGIASESELALAKSLPKRTPGSWIRILDILYTLFVEDMYEIDAMGVHVFDEEFHCDISEYDLVVRGL
jgi:hypothetical protein